MRIYKFRQPEFDLSGMKFCHPAENLRQNPNSHREEFEATTRTQLVGSLSAAVYPPPDQGMEAVPAGAGLYSNSCQDARRLR